MSGGISPDTGSREGETYPDINIPLRLYKIIHI